METYRHAARIVSEVEYEKGLEEGTLSSKKVSKSISTARRIAILKLREAGMSWPEVGHVLRRHHVSVMRMISPRKRAAKPKKVKK